MDWLTFISEIVGAVAWPATLVVLVFILRKPLKELLPALLRLRYKDFELEFSRELDQLRARLEETKPEQPAMRQAEVGATEKPTSTPKRLARISPRASVSEAWRGVEHALQQVAEEHGIPEPCNPMRLASELVSLGVIPESTASLVNHLLNLRNEAVHAGEFDLSEREALEYNELAEEITTRITPRLT